MNWFLYDRTSATKELSELINLCMNIIIWQRNFGKKISVSLFNTPATISFAAYSGSVHVNNGDLNKTLTNFLNQYSSSKESSPNFASNNKRI